MRSVLKQIGGFSPDVSIFFPLLQAIFRQPSQAGEIVKKDLPVQVLLPMQKYTYAERLMALH